MKKKKDLSLHLWGPWVFDVIECLDNFLCFSLSSWTSPFWKRSVLFFSEGLPRTVFAFVSLTRDNIIEQYINTFLETPRPNVIQTASYCCFKKFQIKRHPNRRSLDYPLNLTKSTNHKIRKRKWIYNKENSKFIWPVREHAIKTVFLWLVHFDPLVKKMSDTNHLSWPLRKQKFTSTGSKGHCLWFVISRFRSILWVSVSEGSLLVILLWPNIKPGVNIPNIFDRFHPWTSDKFRWGKSAEDSD